LEYLPPYSPDFNPIEEAFSAFKSHVRRHGHTFRALVEYAETDDVVGWLYASLDKCISVDSVQGWFRHSS
ncbi:hypothetical protein DL93DRAFT_2029437, partial [Clavulina sp. PMI_390]